MSRDASSAERCAQSERHSGRGALVQAQVAIKQDIDLGEGSESESYACYVQVE